MEKVWTVLELIQWTTAFLKQKGIENGRREAEDLLGQVLELDRLKLYLAFEEKPSPTELAMFRDLVARRGRREPLQYLLGWQPFLGMKIRCDARALIPRPETERLAQIALEILKNLGPQARFADIGTGSGCIALALLKEWDGSGIASDCSQDALNLARENAEAQGVLERLRLVLGRDLDPLTEAVDMIVSNPPYIPEDKRNGLQTEVRDYEPGEALFSGPEGLDMLRCLVQQAPNRLRQGGWLMLECGENQPQVLQKESSEAWAEARVEQDPYGVPRFFIARKK